MKIALDATYSAGKNLSGVGVYSREILEGLARRGGAEWLWCYRPHRLLKSFDGPIPPHCHRRPLFESWIPNAAVFHGLNQRLPHARFRKAAVTFHDLFTMTANYSTPEFRFRFSELSRHAAEAAQIAIAVSQFTADQVHELLRVDRSRIRVIHHGVRTPLSRPDLPKENVILSVGAVQRRKNTVRLIDAFERMPRGWTLVLAGSMGFEAEEAVARAKASSRRDDIRFTGWVDDAALEELYARAKIFAFPSLDEGFGMPVLEAMARGIPVVTSNCSAMPEVSGSAALLVDPHNTDELSTALKKLARDEDARAKLVEAGLRRASEFTWEKAVEETWKVYCELAR